MNNNLYKKILLFVFAASLLPTFAFAQTPRLLVEFIPDPLFSEASILPGDSASGIVRVTNNSGEDQIVITEAINVLDPLGLSGHMSLVISDDSSNVFWNAIDGTFQDFLTSGLLDLTSPLGDGQTIEYTYSVSFANISDNSFQLAELGFDLCVGFKDEISGMNCGDTAVSGEGDTEGGLDNQGDGGTTTAGVGNVGPSGGGGGPVDIVHLQIQNERVVNIDEGTGSAIIAWETNLFSTSQVVYGLASGGPYSLVTDALNYGYPLATIEDEYKILSHAVVLSGLIPGEEYVYRVVSRASPPTVSYAHNFVVKDQEIVPDDVVFVEEVIEQLEVAQEQAQTQSIQTTGRTGSNRGGSSNNVIIAALPQNNSVIDERFGNNSGSFEDDEETATTTRRGELERLVNEIEAIQGAQATPDETSASNEELKETNESQAAAAALGGFFSLDSHCLLLTLIMLLIIGILYAIYRLSTGQHSSVREKKIAITGLFIAAILVALFTKLFCTIIFLVVAYMISYFATRE